MVLDVNVVTNWWTIAGVIASFLVAFVALLIAWLANRQVYKKNKLEKKEKGLKEIIDWTEAIIKFTAHLIVINTSNRSRIITEAAERVKELNGLATKGIYIEASAQRLFPKNNDLLADIRTFRRRIAESTDSLILVVKKEVKVTNEWEETMEQLLKLRDDAITLVRLATRIYTEIK